MMNHQPEGSTPFEDALVKRASVISLVVSVILLTIKFIAFRLTHSQAVFSDALESVVNVIAASLALGVLVVAHKPADQEHPYGHGKVEFFSAAFEGGLVTFASLLICVEAVRAFFRGQDIAAFGIGLALVLGAGLCNAALGFYLLRVGRKYQSATLEASGLHVLSDFWTSLGVVIGLGLVSATGLTWIDPAIALIVGLLLARTGYSLVRRSVGGLLDEEDKSTLEQILNLIARLQPTGIIQVHHVRVMRSGRYHHIDAHAVVPEFWDVSEAHAQTENFERTLMKDYPHPGELHLHVDPCRRAYCKVCDVADCPIRLQPFISRRPPSIEELTSPNEPSAFWPEETREK